MFTRQIILPAICCIPLLSGCASNQPANTTAWLVKPMDSIRTSNDKPEALYQLGRYYQGQNRYEQAMLAYQKALTIDHNFVEARNGLGVIYSIQGKYAEAIDVLKVAVRQAPKAAHIYNNLGYAYYLQGRNEEAIASLRAAASLDPGNQRALNNLGLAYAKAGDHADSKMAFTLANKLPEVTVASITTADNTTASTVAQDTAHSLALPKDRGVINRVAATLVPQIDSPIKAVQVAPNVYELREQHVLPVQVAATTAMEQTKLEIANGNGVTGMAKKVKQFLYGQGYITERLTNQKPYKVQVTQIQYRHGHQLEAQHLQSNLPRQSELVQNDAIHANINVRLVLGKNIAENLAFFNGKSEKTRLALNER